jgi:hypothetical protein
MTTSVALFDCPHCIDEFRFDYQRIAKLNYGWRVRVRCPGCGNIVEVVMLNYTLIHGCDPDKYRPGEIVEILRPDPNLSNHWWMEANRVTESEGRFCKRRPDGVRSATRLFLNGVKFYVHRMDMVKS